MDKISVIMPCFNAEDFIHEAIQSILDQTHTNIEFLIINDGSTDNTENIINKFQDERIVLITRENRGLIYSLNQGIELATGKWIARMDSDDISHRDRLEKQLAWMKMYELDICGTSILIFGETLLAHAKNYPVDTISCMALLPFGVCFAHGSIMARSDHFKKYRYDPKFKFAEDYELWYRMSINDASMGNIPDILYEYRQHSDQVSSTKAMNQSIVSNDIRCKIFKNLIGSSEISSQEISEVLKICYQPIQINNIQLDLSKVNKVFDKYLLKFNVNKRTEFLIHNLLPCYLRASVYESDSIKAFNKLVHRHNIKLPYRIKAVTFVVKFTPKRLLVYMYKYGNLFKYFLYKRI